MARGCGKRPRKTAKQIWIRKIVKAFLRRIRIRIECEVRFFIACSYHENMCILILHKGGDEMHLLSTRDDAD